MKVKRKGGKKTELVWKTVGSITGGFWFVSGDGLESVPD